ncbi:hypothetical protein JTB14_017028 [Gonioctena quinquepunctata]|nr:hypothetical protein JTB14_017028 [Gonioctena quinquepunctata]
MKVHYFRFGKYNRTVKSGNIEVDFFMDVNKEKDITIFLTFYIFKSNEYRRTPIMIPTKLCDILGTEKYDIPNIMGNASFHSCPVSKVILRVKPKYITLCAGYTSFH